MAGAVQVVGLQEVLEYVQDSKSTLFLVLDLVTGGELFDRIGPGRGTSEVRASPSQDCYLGLKYLGCLESSFDVIER